MDPVPVRNQDVDFGAEPFVLARILPKEEVPHEFWNYHNPYHEIVEEWFFDGLQDSRLKERVGVDRHLALRHIAAILRSFDTEHGTKIATCAYLLSQWFESR